MEKKFSKGKWIISGSCRDSIRISTENYDVVADVYDGWNSVDKQIDMDICVANAKLIAAAPEMLNVLSTIENDNWEIPDWLWKRIKDVINKATE